MSKKSQLTYDDIFAQKFEEWKRLIPREAHSVLESMRPSFQAIDEKYAPLYTHASPNSSAKDPSFTTSPLKSAYDIKDKLDAYVVGQHDAKKVISQVSFYHASHVQREIETGSINEDYIKASILLIGPTGSGKTLLVNTLSRILQVPFVKVDATSMTKTGFVGDSIQDAVRELYYITDGDLAKAESGIILVDEVDKLAGGSWDDYVSNSVVTGKGVQQELLRPMENSMIDLFSQTNINSIREMMRGGDMENQKISTRNILFILAGAFEGLEDVILKRLKKERGHSIGFGESVPLTLNDVSLDMVKPEDLIDYGLIPELVGRVTYTVPLERLNAEKLYHILRDAQGSIARQIENNILETTGKKVSFTDEALQTIAEEAAKFQTGGRALTEICYRIMNELLFHLPSLEIDQYTITPEFVKNYLAMTYHLIIQPHVKQALRKFPFVAETIDWDKTALDYINHKLIERKIVSIHKYVGDFLTAWAPIIQRIELEQSRVVITGEVLELHDTHTNEANEQIYEVLKKNKDLSRFTIMLQGSA